MTATTYPSPIPSHRHADMAVHAFGLSLILAAAGLLAFTATATLDHRLILALGVYILSVLASNLASWCYHFGPWHDRRLLLRRIDHAVIYPSITGTFTPFFVLAGTSWTMTLLWLCWGLTALAIWHKITHVTVKTRWSTASYIGLGALGMTALPDLTGVPEITRWCMIAGTSCYMIGRVFYSRKTLPYRYSIWHLWVNFGGILMFAGIWVALFT
ncbi:PAQR family membrane homeostasis protein TrhA [Pseudophaeobacter sp.]|uniref:PAQR family membrane homeostasis protein TrhA n=1 Tax=Pseudophaeobacter sp. TaxID=1971739 RepID=UPI0040595CD6